MRYDWAGGGSNLAFGGMAGIGLDIPVGASTFLRLGIEFQIFFDEGGT
jgi:hypothetical protein